MARIKNELLGFQSIPRDLIFDSSVSDRARFVYCFMASKPHDWDFFLEPMAKEIGYSVETLRKYINELVNNGWLVKGEQGNENGRFGATEYTIKASKVLPCTENTVSENFRVGKIPTQHNIDNIQNKDNEHKDKKEKELKEKEKLFEECWIAYRRKGSKKKSLEYWKKLTDDEKDSVLPHIKAYTSTREIVYQKDFERYLRDKTFNTIVCKGSNTVYDPSINSTNEYRPATDGDILWNEQKKCYIYIGMFWDKIADGYTDANRPDGAEIMLNNARGTIRWNKNLRQWEKK